MKRTFNNFITASLVVAALTIALPVTALSQNNGSSSGLGGGPQGPPPFPPGPEQFLILLCAGQNLQGVTLPVPPARPDDATRAKIDAAIKTCATQFQNAGSSSTSSPNN